MPFGPDCDFDKTIAAFLGAAVMMRRLGQEAQRHRTFLHAAHARAGADARSSLRSKPSVKEIANPVPLGEFTRAIEFRDVGFSYGDAPVLQDVSFTLERGQRLGLAGESGSGKSSLFNLLFRFYDPTSGQVLIDGVPLDQLRIADLRFHMALVSQDILLFNGTVAENIALGKIGATREEVIAAAKEAYAHNFIEELPQGYDTPLGERGQRLSGGQRQRIAIARAFVRNAPIPAMLTDEATKPRSTRSPEAEVQKAIDHLAEHRTVVCVAHRLLPPCAPWTASSCSPKARVVEQGTFDQAHPARPLHRHGGAAEHFPRRRRSETSDDAI